MLFQVCLYLVLPLIQGPVRKNCEVLCGGEGGDLSNGVIGELEAVLPPDREGPGTFVKVKFRALTLFCFHDEGENLF